MQPVLILNLVVTCNSEISSSVPHAQLLRVKECLTDFSFTFTIDIVDAFEEIVAPASTAGRPKEYVRYKTASTRVINAWWHHWHGRPFTRKYSLDNRG